MAQELTLRIITPEKIVVDTTAESVRLPGIDGDMGIYPRHAGMVSALDAGLLRYKAGGMETVMFIAGGFAEVRSGTLRVLTAAGESPEEIDRKRAEEARDRAKTLLGAGAKTTEGEPVDLMRAEAALRRGLMRLQASSRGGR